MSRPSLFNRISILLFTLVGLIAVPGQAQTNLAPKTLEFLDGDRVALVGDTLLEREQEYGYFESRLHTRFAGKKFVIRNLAWSGDTPAGISRASFDFADPAKGRQRLLDQLSALKPTVVFVGYGMASSFEGEKGLAGFKAGLKDLLAATRKISGENVRFILLGTLRHEKLPAPMPDPSAHNETLKSYNNAIREVASEERALFVPVFDQLGDGGTDRPARFYTDDGIHLTAFGYTRFADVVEQALGWMPGTWRLGILKNGDVRPGYVGIQFTNVERTAESVRFVGQENRLVNPQAVELDAPLPSLAPLPQLQVRDLTPGQYALSIDRRVVRIESNTNWDRGVSCFPSPSFDQAEELRLAVVEKNKLFFNRWRPENETYLFGFRKQEQGKNGAEIPMFDPLIQQAEEKIRELATPKSHVYEIAPVAPGTTIRRVTKTPAAEPSLSAPPQPIPEFDVAEGFEVNLFAENPHLSKPIQMNFDSVGRLWVASSSVYPQIQPGQKADDKILILQDLDGDGKAEKSTVFADGLLIPTGVVPGDGGCYVGQSTELLFFKAAPLGGKAASRRVVLSGFGTEDTHHIVHTLRWGHDGQLYFNQSIYIHSHLETPHGVVRLNSGGIFHLRPQTMELGVFLRGFCNPWGHAIDEFGQSFETDGAGFQGVSYGIPGATYFTYAEMRREMKSISPGNYPKFAGLEMIASEHFPAEWQGNLITCDFRAHRVVRFGLSEQGGGYVTRELPDLLRTTNVNFRPIDVKMGPDGALYIADWSNPIIQHGEVDFRDPRRDHEHGRIWRVTAKNRPLNPRKNFITLQPPALLQELLSPNSFNRDQARRTLTERGVAIEPALAAWTQQQTSEKALLEALWMYQSLDRVEPALLEKLLEATDGHVRAAAIRVLSFWENRLPNASELLARRIKDSFPRARIEALRAVAKIPSATSAGLVLSVLEQPTDPFIDYAAWLSINDLALPWISALQSGEWKTEGHEAQLEFGLKSIEPSLASTVLGKILADKSVSSLDKGPWIELIGQSGSANELQQLFEQVRDGGFNDAASVRVLKSLGEAFRLRKLKPAAAQAPIENLLSGKIGAVQLEAIHLAGTWKSSASVSFLVKLAGNSSISAESREAAVQSLREIGGREAVAGLRQLAGKEFDPVTRRNAAAALAAVNLNAALPEILEVLQLPADETESLKFWRALLAIKGAGPVLGKNIKSLPDSMAKAGLRVAREGGRREEQLELTLSRAGNIGEEGQGPTDAAIQQLAKSAAQKGDPVRGEKIFRRMDLGCVNCHAIGGAGGKVGPDLTSIGASAPMDYLVESIFYPNRKIKEGFASIVVQTKDELELSGLLVRENNEELILRDVTNKEVSIPKNKIQSRNTGLSLMPAGLMDALPEADRLDLFRFLSELGKPGPFDASKGGVARSWKLRPGTHTVEQFGEEKFLTADFGGREWASVYSRVNGELPAEDLKAGLAWNNLSQFTSLVALYAATSFQVPKTGPATFDLECGARRPAVFIDGKSLGSGSPIRTELSAGAHVIIIKLDPHQLPDTVRLKSSDVSFLAN